MSRKNFVVFSLIVVIIAVIAYMVYPYTQPKQSSDTVVAQADNTVTPAPVSTTAPAKTIDQSYLDKAPVTLGSDSKPAADKTSVKKSNTTKKPSATATPAPTKSKRVATGKGKTLTFHKGDTVIGYKLEINNKTYTNMGIKNSPMDGKVTDGVIWPYAKEIANVTIVKNADITAAVVTPPTPTIAPQNPRVETGAGKSLAFKVGDTVCGYKLTFDNGKTFSSGVVVKNSPYAGTVTDGVIWPDAAEYKTLRVVDPKVDKPDGATRQVTAAGGTIYFQKGDTVVAKTITINNKTFYNASIVDAPYAGYITDGIIWPTASEMSGYKLVNPDKDPTQLHARLVTAANGTISFNKGDSVWGKQIVIGDKLYQNTYIINANADGYVTNGIVWPNANDIPTDAVKVIFP